jgi:hypothetical protein
MKFYLTSTIAILLYLYSIIPFAPLGIFHLIVFVFSCIIILLNKRKYTIRILICGLILWLPLKSIFFKLNLRYVEANLVYYNYCFPAGFNGDAAIVFGVENAPNLVEINKNRKTALFPDDGILICNEEFSTSFLQDSFFLGDIKGDFNFFCCPNDILLNKNSIICINQIYESTFNNCNYLAFRIYNKNSSKDYKDSTSDVFQKKIEEKISLTLQSNR